MKNIEKRLSEHLRSHDGVISRQEVLRLGGTVALITSRLRWGEWVAVHRGVYRLASAPPSPRQSLRAAVLAVPGAVASHATAAWLLGILPAHRGVDLTVWTNRTRRHAGVTIHRVKRRPPTVHVQGIACTTATRTLVDMAATAPASVLTTAIDRAFQERMTALPRVLVALGTTERGRPGAGILRAVLEARGMVGTPTPSALEIRMDELLHRSGLARPIPQFRVQGGRYRLDYAFPEIRLAIEVKGYVWHSSPEALAADHERERHLINQGWTVLSFTWLDVVRRPEAVIADIATAVARLAA